MNAMRLFIIMLGLVFSAQLMSCKETSSSETVQEKSTDTAPLHKEAPMLEPVDFDKARSKNNAVLVDVRMPQEFEQGHINEAVNINFFDPNFKNQLLDLDKGRKYFVYCKNDSRSERAAEFMMQNDFQDVYVLKGGYVAWKEAGLQ